MNIFTRSGLTIAATFAVAVGFAVTAPEASAVTPKEAGCYYWSQPFQAKTTTTINIRSGPGTKYASLGILQKGTKFEEHCYVSSSDWSYGKVKSGPNKGRFGWVSSPYLTFK